MSIPLLLASVLLCSVAPARADELDDMVKQACTGLSARFNSSGPKADAMDEDIFKASTSELPMKTAMARAGYIGGGRACGADTKANEAKLDGSATTLAGGNAAKARRLVQIFHCTEARSVREAASHWVSQQFCTATLRDYDTYVVKEQPVP